MVKIKTSSVLSWKISICFLYNIIPSEGFICCMECSHVYKRYEEIAIYCVWIKDWCSIFSNVTKWKRKNASFGSFKLILLNRKCRFWVKYKHAQRILQQAYKLFKLSASACYRLIITHLYKTKTTFIVQEPQFKFLFIYFCASQKSHWKWPTPFID